MKISLLELGKALEGPGSRVLKMCLEKEYSISHLQELFEIKGYKNIYYPIKLLEGAGLVKLRKTENEQGKPVYVSTNRDMVVRVVVEQLKNLKDIIVVTQPKFRDRVNNCILTHNSNRKVSQEELIKKIPELDGSGLGLYIAAYHKDLLLDMGLTDYGKKIEDKK